MSALTFRKASRRLTLVLALVFSFNGCSSATLGCLTGGPGSAYRSIYAVAYSWHSGIVIPARAFKHSPHCDLSEEFAGASYLEFGWGDDRYYRAQEDSFLSALRAALASEQSTLRVAPLQSPLNQYFTAGEIAELHVSPDGFEAVVAFVCKTFLRQAGKELPVERRERETFFAAKPSFGLLYNCNDWTAQALQAAGCSVSRGIVTTNRLIFAQAKKFEAGRAAAPAPAHTTR